VEKRSTCFVEAGTTTLWGNLDVEEFVLQTAEIYAERPAVADLHRHVSVCTDLAQEFDEDSPARGRLLKALTEASHAFPFDAESDAAFREGRGGRTRAAPGRRIGGYLRPDGSAADCRWSRPSRPGLALAVVRDGAKVQPVVCECPPVDGVVPRVHVHAEPAPPLRVGSPPVSRPVHRYSGTDPEGRWQPEGTLWVESDINNVGAEALARQFLYGKRYFREEFDRDPEVTFIPDVFGYSAGLPGISRAADCPYFLTQKMSWNEVNDFPTRRSDGKESMARSCSPTSHPSIRITGKWKFRR